MNTFKKKSLYAALAGASALGVTGAAHAVNVNPDGLGQVLLYPYYTIQDKVPGAPFGSLLSVVNSTASVKAVKVRFLEGKNSWEVLDFNLFLSPRDVWTAAVLPVGVGAGVATADKSCTVPVVSNNAASPTPFVNYAYAGIDLAGDGLERTKEGYVEIIEMGVPLDTTIIKSITHVNGVPPCTGLAGLTSSISMGAPQGGLFGGMTLINVLAGEDYTEDAVALADFRNNGFYDLPGAITPDLTQVNPPTAIVTNGSLFNGGGTVMSSNWFQPIDAISALFMHDHVYNEFVLDSGTKSGTDWVVTMPTKRYYYNPASAVDGIIPVLYLFQRNFTSNGACDDILMDVYDREEAVVPVTVGFSPPRPGAKANTLCWEANVISFNSTNVLGSKNNRNITTTYQNGWGDLQFPVPAGGIGETGAPAHKLISLTTTETSIYGTTQGGIATYLGLPVIGFAVQSFNNGTLTDSQGRLLQSQYGGNFVHKTKRTINFTRYVGAN
jgi:hypothetical protein